LTVHAFTRPCNAPLSHWLSQLVGFCRAVSRTTPLAALRPLACRTMWSATIRTANSVSVESSPAQRELHIKPQLGAELPWEEDMSRWSRSVTSRFSEEASSGSHRYRSVPSG
jgi:hypothetical protein